MHAQTAILLKDVYFIKRLFVCSRVCPPVCRGFRCVFLPADWETRADKFSHPSTAALGGRRHDFGTVACAVMLRKDCTSCHMQLPINSWPVAVCPLQLTRAQTDALICIYRRKERENREKLNDIKWWSVFFKLIYCVFVHVWWSRVQTKPVEHFNLYTINEIMMLTQMY